MRRAVVSTLALIAALSGAAHALLPPPIAKAFQNAGVPLDAVTLVVQETGGARTLLSHNPSKPMNPASVMKLSLIHISEPTRPY